MPALKVTTLRLHLRPLGVDDARDLFRYTSDPDTTRFLAWPTHHRIKEATDYIRKREDEWASGSRFTYAICQINTDVMLGHIRLTPNEKSLNLGYAISSAHAGRGFMTEAISALLSLRWPDCSKASAYCCIQNRASQRVLEKLGFSLAETRQGWKKFPNYRTDPLDCVFFERAL